MNRRNRFLSNAMLLSVISILMRAVSVSFNAYVNEKIGTESMGLFTLVMSVYSFAMTVALSCVNLGAVRLTSERCARLEGADKASWRYAMKKVIRAVCAYSLLFGVLSAVALYFSANALAKYVLNDMRTVSSLRVMALSLPAISLSSALSGYFTGLRKVSKNAVVTVLEQFMKIIVISTALTAILPGNVENACLAVVGGGVISEAWSLVVNLVLFVTDSRKPTDVKFGNQSMRLGTKWKEVSDISLPTAVGTYARQGLTTLEHLAIPIGLRKSGLSPAKALSAYGLLQGIAFPLVMFPYAVIGSFTALLVPEMAEKHALNDREGIAGMTREVLRYSAIFSVAACGIFANYASELGRLIYHSEEAAVYTLMLGLLVPFMYLDTAVDSLLKGLGEQVYIMKVNILDSGAGLLLVVLTTPILGIYGYILTIWICELGNLYASIRMLGKKTGVGLKTAISQYKKPVLVCLGLTVIKWTLLRNTGPVASILVFVALYVSCIFLSRSKKRRVKAS